MNPSSAHALNAQSAYGDTGRNIGSDRDVEVKVFQRSIARMKPLIGSDFKLTPDAASVLSENLRLWDMLVIDLLHPDNVMSDTLIRQLVNLSAFVRQHTLALYAGEGQVDVLVDINTAILRGLLGHTEEGTGNRQAA